MGFHVTVNVLYVVNRNCDIVIKNISYLHPCETGLPRFYHHHQQHQRHQTSSLTMANTVLSLTERLTGMVPLPNGVHDAPGLTSHQSTVNGISVTKSKSSHSTYNRLNGVSRCIHSTRLELHRPTPAATTTSTFTLIPRIRYPRRLNARKGKLRELSGINSACQKEQLFPFSKIPGRHVTASTYPASRAMT